MKRIQFNGVFVLSAFFFITCFNSLNGQDFKEQIVENGRISGQKLKDLFPKLEKAANEGNAEALFFLAQYYYTNQSKDDDHLTNEYIKKAAEKGYAEAQMTMVALERNQSNWEGSLEWAEKCAEQNHIGCLIYLIEDGKKQEGEIYSDETKAWMKKLALLEISLEFQEELQKIGSNFLGAADNKVQQGKYYEILAARVNLAENYKEGLRGFDKNAFQAYVWYLIYNENKVIGGVRQRKAIMAINALEKELSETEIKEAVKEAEKLLGSALGNLKNLKLEERF